VLSDGFFQRYRASDPDALARQIEEDRSRLAAMRLAGDAASELAASCRLGLNLTIAGDERGAAAILEPALALARRLGDKVREVEALLSLATAQQYLGERAAAQILFQEALDRARADHVSQFEHFILHHRGRCHVEQGEIAAARDCFVAALALRKALGEPRFIASTERALAALDTA
jgi:tetratricopeptide (TPR) repeat protein